MSDKNADEHHVPITSSPSQEPQPQQRSQSQPLSSYSVAKCQELGRYLIATRDLKKGEIIFQEFPLAAAPQKTSSLICPGCFNTPESQCPNCGWPLCSAEECPGIARHAEVECKLLRLRLNSVSIPDDDETAGESNGATTEECKIEMKSDGRNWSLLQDTLMVIRCLDLKYSNEGKWNELLDMDPNWERWSSSALHEPSLNLVTTMRSEYHISEDRYKTEEIMKVLAILDTNAYEVKMPDMNIQGAYKLASLAEHNCVPNAIKTTSSESLLLTLRAAKDIAKGEHISTSYCDILWPTFQRQRYMQWSKFFICQCQRCLSPTELNSHISSFLCPRCPFGIPLIPDLNKSESAQKNPHRKQEITWMNTYKDYHCIACGCEFGAKTCELTVTKAESELQEIERQDGENTSSFEDWLKKWTVGPAASKSVPEPITERTRTSERCGDNNKAHLETSTSGDDHKSHEDTVYPMKTILRLHPQHALCLDACHTAFLLYSTDAEALEELKRKESLGIHLLQATKNLFTDIAMFRGTVMYELAITKASLLTRYINDDEDSVPDLITLAKEILWLMTESLEILKYESEDQPEGKLFTLAFKQLEDLRPFLQEMISNNSTK